MDEERDLSLEIEPMEEIKEVKLPDAPKDKAKQILESNMSEDEKEKYLRRLGLKADSGEKQEGKLIPFPIYAKIRKIKPELHKAMQVYPKAKGLKGASLAEWDEIFKSF